MVRERNIALCIVFTIITFGIYGLYWIICITNDSLELSSEHGTTGGWVVVFSIITFGLYLLYWAYKMGERIDVIRQKHGLLSNPTNGILYLILCLVGLSVISLAIMQSEINRFAGPSPGNYSF